MTFFVRRCLLLFMIAELFIFFVIYCFGPKGLKTLYNIGHVQLQVRNDICKLQQDIETLKKEIGRNQTDFVQEKIARERLLMKKNDEMVYFKTKIR